MPSFVMGYVVGGVVGIAVTLYTYKTLKIETIANLGVAIGTIALAYFTWQSVRKTSDVITGEERRHQQGFIPIIRIPPDITSDGTKQKFYCTVRNVGQGGAFNVRFAVEGSGRLEVRHRDQPAPVQGAVFTHEVAKQFDIKFNLLFEAPLVAAGQDQIHAYSQKITELSNLAECGLLITFSRLANPIYTAASVKYDDMFGNEYEIRYSDFQDQVFELIQPTNLRAPKSA